ASDDPIFLHREAAANFTYSPTIRHPSLRDTWLFFQQSIQVRANPVRSHTTNSVEQISQQLEPFRIPNPTWRPHRTQHPWLRLAHNPDRI
ncbi:MAG: hypothetical protein K2Z81_26165, partial [Cyanobacteria bacterium]|nr:hypothetical protein [Cyanobacteriota bacterium]